MKYPQYQLELSLMVFELTPGFLPAPDDVINLPVFCLVAWHPADTSESSCQPRDLLAVIRG